MPSDPLKPSGWSTETNSNEPDNFSHYYVAVSQYNQHYNLYNSPYYRIPYLQAANASGIYGHGYPTGLDYNGYPAYSVQYYNKSMSGANASTLPISTFQQYTNNLVNAGNFNAVAAAINQSNGAQSSNSYYSGSAQKSSENRPKKTKRKKQSTGSDKQEVSYKRVYVWELDDLYSDEFAHQLLYNSDLKKLIGQVLTLCFQLGSADDFDHTNIEDANVDENLNDHTNSIFSNDFNSSATLALKNEKSEKTTTDTNAQQLINDPLGANLTALDNIKRMAACQQRIRNVYTRHQQDIMGLIKNYGLESEIPALCRMLEPMRRLDASRPFAQCLKLISERSAQSVATGGPQQINVVLAHEPLSFALAKLLIHGSSTAVDVANVYSASRSELSITMERVITRFKREKLMMVSSKSETMQLARNLNIPLWPVNQSKDVENLYVALDRILC